MALTHGSGGQQRLPEPRFLTLARVLRGWGIRGDVKIQPFTDRPADLARFERVFIGPQPREYVVEKFRPHQGNWLLKLSGVDTRSAADELRGLLIVIPREEHALETDEYYADQVLGLQVKTIEGAALGVVTEILATGANDVYVVKGDRGEVLLPARPEVIRSIDPEAGVMIVELLPGLID